MFVLSVIKALKKHKVNYALVGGYAVALHGAIRGTVDVDFVIKQSKAQFIQLEKAMKSCGLVSRLPVSAADVFLFRDEYINNRNMLAWSFYNPANPLEVVDVLIAEDLSNMNTIIMKVGSDKIIVVSIEGLIEMKKRAGRKQDIEDVKALEQLL